MTDSGIKINENSLFWYNERMNRRRGLENGIFERASTLNGLTLSMSPVIDKLEVVYC
jgi:hypothetical protein